MWSFNKSKTNKIIQNFQLVQDLIMTKSEHASRSPVILNSPHVRMAYGEWGKDISFSSA